MSQPRKTRRITTLNPTGNGSIPIVYRLVSIAAAGVMSLLIVLGIARAQKTSIPDSPPPLQELRALASEAPPPPPPITTVFEQIPRIPVELETMPEEGGIELAAVIEPQDLPLPTVAPPTLELAMEEFKPRGEPREASPNYVYQSHQVDQRPVVLFRKIPQIPPEVIRSVEVPRAVLLFVVNTDGLVEQMNILDTPSEEFGEIIADAVKDWRFQPAIKNGRKVRCLAQLPVNIKMRAPNPFR